MQPMKNITMFESELQVVIFFILIYYASKTNITLLFDTGSKCKRRFLNISQLAHDFTPLYCYALLGLHAFSRCDTTSAFKGIEKGKPIKLLQKKPHYQIVFQNLGKSWDVSEDLFLPLEEFTCSMYKSRGSHLNVDLRYKMVLKKFCGKENQLNPNKSTEWSSFPPPRSCLREHIRRVNYQVVIWKRAHIPKPVVPLSTEDSEWILVNEVIESKWCDGDLLLTHLADILDKAIETENEYRLNDGSTDEISTDDKSDKELDSETDNDSD